MRCLMLCTAAVLLVAAGGCARPRYPLHGIVRYKGEPVTAGTIIFLGPDNQVYPAKIQSDGSYQMAAVPRGHILVAIQPAVSRGPSRPQPGAEGITKTDDGAHQRASK